MTSLFNRFTDHRRAALGIALLGSALFANCALGAEYVKSYSIANRAVVHVTTNDGSVSIITDDSKQVELRVQFEGYELDKTLHVDSSQQGDQVELTARVVGQFGIMLGRRKVHIEIRMPKDGDLQVETGDGAVEASALNGSISIHTHDGSIKANHLSGSIDLHSGDGSINVSSLMGSVRLRTGDGAIEGSDLDGTFEANSGDGRIRLVGRFDALKVKSGDGGVEARALQGSKLDSAWNVVTGSGSVEIALPGTLQVNIDATTGDGHISLDMPVSVQGTISKSQVHGKMNGGGQTLTIHTGDGSIHLKQV
jgi:DUF4097 and DUF4098 domain-containing protein YvlB